MCPFQESSLFKLAFVIVIKIISPKFVSIVVGYFDLIVIKQALGLNLAEFTLE